MDEYVEGDLRIACKKQAGSLRLLWSGKSNARDPAATLQPFFEKVAQEAQGEKLTSVEIRLNDLEYFNSSTLAAIIRGIRHFRQSELRVAIAYKESSGWQRRSCEALRILESDGVVTIHHD